jgi:DNA-directed RNA polymerase specialized sigma24 family protein
MSQPLSAERERLLFQRLPGLQGRRALAELAEHFIGMAQSEALRIAGDRMDESEVKSLASSVLLQTLKAFKLSRNTRFSVYLRKALFQEISNLRADAFFRSADRVWYGRTQRGGEQGSRRNPSTGAMMPVFHGGESAGVNLVTISREYLYPMMRLLPRDDQRLLRAYFFRGLNIVQIAERRHVTKQAISLQLHKALDRLRKKMAHAPVSLKDL